MTSHELLIDKRIVQRNIEQGKLEPAEYQRLLNALPDLSDKVWRRPARRNAAVEQRAEHTGLLRPTAPAPEPVPASRAAPRKRPLAARAAPAVQTQPTALPG